jgi:hypothetical protein
MARPSLRHAQAIVAEFCRQRGIPYCQTSLAGSYAQALRFLDAVGRPDQAAEQAT